MPTTRRYDRSRRLTEAAARREQVLGAATDRFSRLGWHGTTIADIAADAGVSAELIRRQWTKAQLLMAAFRRASFGEHADLQEAFAALRLDELADVDSRLETVARFAAQALVPMAPMVPCLTEAAQTDEAAAAIRQQAQQRRMETSRTLVALLTRGDAPGRDAVAELHMLTSAETYLQLVEQGWTAERYARWLRSALDRCVNG